MSEDRLGELLSSHPVANRRRWITGSVALAGAVAGGVVLALLVSVATGGAGGKLAGLALVAIVGGLTIAAVRLGAAIRGGRGETVEIHEHGIAHCRRGSVRRWSWQQVATVRVPSAANSDGALSRLFGPDHHCLVRFTDGPRLRVNGMTGDGAQIVRALLAHRPDAVPPADEPAPWERVAVWVLPVLILASGASLAYLIGYVATHGDRLVETHPGLFTTKQGISDSAGAAIATGMIAAVATLVLTTSAFVVVCRDLRRSRRSRR